MDNILNKARNYYIQLIQKLKRNELLKFLCILSGWLLIASCSPKLNTPAKLNIGETFKVMTYNIHHANPTSKTGLIDLGAIAAVINKEKPDLVGLQEVDRFTKRSGNTDEAKALAERTGLNYYFFKAIDYDGGDYGVAILSRYPIKNPLKLALPQVAKGEPRVLSYVDVVLPNKTILTFSNTHLDATRPDSNRVAQMKTIVNELNTKKNAIILVGDLNCESRAEPIILLDQYFKRSCVSNCSPTIPQDKPTKTIDYIALRNANWSVKEHRVISEVYASDHRPVVAVYQLK
ncbi:endonuclease/exonuclease/phosphatase family protein [Pedobacter sp. Du54]|uniref:endonuclease/exonuclease/phosphatase family protein n=1 Tax=Pedobacter anseongensis TaxID=3133439 RepID=UPI0030A6A09A